MTRHRVPDEQYGRLRRRLDEVARRVDEGTLPFGHTMGVVQKIVDGDFHSLSFFQRDMCAEQGWELEEDVADRVVPVKKLEVFSVFEDDEGGIPLHEFLERAREGGALLGQRQAEHILEKGKSDLSGASIPTADRPYYPFFGTLWREGPILFYPELAWHSNGWAMEFRPLGRGTAGAQAWPSYSALVRPRER